MSPMNDNRLSILHCGARQTLQCLSSVPHLEQSSQGSRETSRKRTIINTRRMLQLVLRISAVGAVGLGTVAFGIDQWDWGRLTPGRIMGGEKGAPCSILIVPSLLMRSPSRRSHRAQRCDWGVVRGCQHRGHRVSRASPRHGEHLLARHGCCGASALPWSETWLRHARDDGRGSSDHCHGLWQTVVLIDAL